MFRDGGSASVENFASAHIHDDWQSREIARLAGIGDDDYWTDGQPTQKRFCAKNITQEDLDAAIAAYRVAPPPLLSASPPPSPAVVALEGMGRDPIQFVRDDSLIAPTTVEIDIRGESYTFSHRDALAFVGAFTVTLAREPAVLKLASGQTVTVTIDDIEHIGRQLTEKGLQ